MKAHQLRRAKRDIRAAVLAARDALPEAEREERAAKISASFLALPEVGSADLVMLYWSFGSEPPTGNILAALRARGTTTALPRIDGDGLDARSYAPGDPVTETSFGACEPAAGTRVEPTAIDVVVTPGVAFDHRGRRVGYGGGYYDRFLPTVAPEAVRIAIAFEVQLVEDDLPAGHFDLPVDVVVTEAKVLRIGDGAARTS
jgi:5-formyltetrahydrofolate cyclo-ligase